MRRAFLPNLGAPAALSRVAISNVRTEPALRVAAGHSNSDVPAALRRVLAAGGAAW